MLKGDEEKSYLSTFLRGVTVPTLHRSPTAGDAYGNLYEEEIPNGQNARAYIVYYMMGQKLVGLRRANWQGQSNGQYRIVGDMLGSTTLLVDTSTSPGPQVVQRQYYKPYGEVAFSWGSSRTSIGYTGQRLDGESGLMYYGARYYDPALSFFTQADPTTPDPRNTKDWDRYLYVRGNPLRYIDTSGYGPEDYYFFVNGCSVSSGSDNCGGDSPDWGEYTTFLRQQYNRWRQQYARYGEEDANAILGSSWQDWAFNRGHVQYVHATPDISGSKAELERRLAEIPQDGGKIHLIGHSWGGAVIMAYLQAKQLAERYPVAGVSQLDKRIASATIIDAPLPVVGSDLLPQGLGSWLKEKGIKTQIIDVADDWIGGENSDVPYIGNPDYLQDIYGRPRPSSGPDAVPSGVDPAKWHEYTFRHMARQTREFLATAWR